MTICELASEYQRQYTILCNHIDGLRPLLCIYQGQDLLNLQRKIKTYYDMAGECRNTAAMLGTYYEEDANEKRD